jgi:hypothetical protein
VEKPLWVLRGGAGWGSAGRRFAAPQGACCSV